MNSTVHTEYSVRVTEAKDDGQCAYVGQSLFRLGDDVYGGTLCRVYREKAEDANRLAKEIAERWNNYTTPTKEER